MDEQGRQADPRATDDPSAASLGGTARLDRELVRLGDEVRTTDAARSRSRAHWLRHQADEEATLAGVLVDLAERGDLVALTTASGRRHRGQLRSVAGDFCVLHAASGHQVLVSFTALASVRCEPGRPAAGGDRDIVSRRSLADHLAALADRRPRLTVTTRAPDETVSGVLRSVGRDVLVVGLDGDARGVVYVPVASVAEVSLAPGSWPVSG
jgi:hypothetical protein